MHYQRCRHYSCTWSAPGIVQLASSYTSKPCSGVFFDSSPSHNRKPVSPPLLWPSPPLPPHFCRCLTPSSAHPWRLPTLPGASPATSTDPSAASTVPFATGEVKDTGRLQAAPCDPSTSCSRCHPIQSTPQTSTHNTLVLNCFSKPLPPPPNRCYHEFDHHCPIILNCVGAANRRAFFMYLWTLFPAELIWLGLATQYHRR